MSWLNWPSLFIGIGIGVVLSLVGAFCIGIRIAREDLREEDKEREAYRRLDGEGRDD